MNTIQFIALAICLILTVQLHAWADGVRDNGGKEYEKYIQLARVFVFFIMMYLVEDGNLKLIIMIGATYAGLRISLFDFIHNYVCNQKWYYSGKLSFSDRMVSKMTIFNRAIYRLFAFAFACISYYLVVTKCI